MDMTKDFYDLIEEESLTKLNNLLQYGMVLEEYIEEAKRRKGVEFDLYKNADSKNIKNSISRTPIGQALSTQGKDKKGKLSTTSVGYDKIDSNQKTRAETYELWNKQREKIVLESKDIVQAYQAYLVADLDKIIKSENSLLGYKQDQDSRIDSVIKQLYTQLKDDGIEESKIRKYLLNTFYDVSDDPDHIRKLLNLRLNYNKNYIRVIQKMIQNNYKLLGMTEEQLKWMLSELDKGGESAGDSISRIKYLIFQNKDKFVKNNEETIDLTSLGFGIIYLSPKNMYFNFETSSAKQSTALDQLIDKAIRYDAVVLCHGGSTNKAGVKLSDMGANGSGLGKDEKDKLSNFKKQWVMQPIRTLNSGYFNSVDDFIRQLIKEGKKKILIASCNPGSHRLPADIMRKEGITINYSDFSNLLESFDNTDDFDEIINEYNSNLKSFADSFNIDINDDYTLHESYNWCMQNQDYIIQESSVKDAWEWVKRVFNRVVEGIIYIFKQIGSYIMKVINKIREKIKEARGKKHKLEKPVKLAIITVDGNGKVDEYETDDVDVVKEKTLEACKKMYNKINQIQDKEQQGLKREEQNINQKMSKDIRNMDREEFDKHMGDKNSHLVFDSDSITFRKNN